MKFKIWDTPISKESLMYVDIEQIIHTPNFNLAATITSHEKKFKLNAAMVLVHEVGHEVNYLELWTVLNSQIERDGRTTLELLDSPWIKSHNFFEETRHFIVLSVDIVLHIASETEPIIERIK